MQPALTASAIGPLPFFVPSLVLRRGGFFPLPFFVFLPFALDGLRFFPESWPRLTTVHFLFAMFVLWDIVRSVNRFKEGDMLRFMKPFSNSDVNNQFLDSL
jgi:hypothetical protein